MGDLQVVEEEGDICGRQILLGNSERNKGKEHDGYLANRHLPETLLFFLLDSN